jgi:hypothetical protein
LRELGIGAVAIDLQRAVETCKVPGKPRVLAVRRVDISKDRSTLYVSNLALFLRYAGAKPAVDSAWTQQIRGYTVSQLQPITLTILSGSVCMFSNLSGSGNWFARGIKNLVVSGYGATLSDKNGTGNGFFLGGLGIFGGNAHSSRVATVAAGTSTVTLRNPSESARFTVGNWALMTGFDMQGYGYPPNPAFFEYVQITAINSSSGIITFAAPLKNTYKSRWPLYNPSNAFQSENGGPATLYVLDSSWVEHWAVELSLFVKEIGGASREEAVVVVTFIRSLRL